MYGEENNKSEMPLLEITLIEVSFQFRLQLTTKFSLYIPCIRYDIILQHIIFCIAMGAWYIPTPLLLCLDSSTWRACIWAALDSLAEATRAEKNTRWYIVSS